MKKKIYEFKDRERVRVILKGVCTNKSLQANEDKIFKLMEDMERKELTSKEISDRINDISDGFKEVTIEYLD